MPRSRGKKEQGQRVGAKLYNIRHGHAPRRSCNAAEKAAETTVRHAGRREISFQLTDLLCYWCGCGVAAGKACPRCGRFAPSP
jgi:hypothetical protein